MDRCAIFVDAGYLYASGGLLCCGTRARKDLELAAEEFNKLLVSIAVGRCPVPVLRTYWYDGAKNGIPSTQQQRIAALPNLKLRLGRLNTNNQQKGVDALIYRDMMTLSSERAVTDAFLVSGDEDLREAVKAAQDRGVRLFLIGIEAVQGFNQSRELTEEADEVITLTKQELAPLIKLGRSASPAVLTPSVPAGTTDTSSPEEAGRTYARKWIANATPSDVRGLVGVHPRIPRTLDVELLRSTEIAMNRSVRGDDGTHRATRAAFWAVVRDAASRLPTDS